ncbi:MAG: YbjN domain-containing protein, partial [Odoribacter sp.]|nr:YbjN domain-containing protein [Odoribacter sp.]
KKNFEPLLRYLLQSTDTCPYQLGVENNQIFLSYRVHLSDIQADTDSVIRKNITEFAFQTDRIANFLSEEFGCDLPEYSRK